MQLLNSLPYSLPFTILKANDSKQSAILMCQKSPVFQGSCQVLQKNVEFCISLCYTDHKSWICVLVCQCVRYFTTSKTCCQALFPWISGGFPPFFIAFFPSPICTTPFPLFSVLSHCILGASDILYKTPLKFR